MSTGSGDAYRWRQSGGNYHWTGRPAVPTAQTSQSAPTAGPHASWPGAGAPAGRPSAAPVIQLLPNGSKTEADAGLAGASATRRAPGTRDLRASNNADGVPDAPTRFAELETMSLNDLRTLLEERAKFEDFVSKHPYQKVVDDFVANVRSQVENLESNHRKQPTGDIDSITEDEEDVESMQKKVHDLQQQVNDLQKTQDEWYVQHSPERLMERLRVGIAELQKTTETLEKNMLSSSMNFDDFLTRYIECRKKYHERCLKLEQLKHESRYNIRLGR